jgi:ribosomal protein S18 acetylase RimI-like enzyme
MLIPSLDLVCRTIQTEAAYTLSRLKVLERLPGNPVGIAYREIEGVAVAFLARHLPVPDFNSVVGLRAGQEKEIGPLVAWYREHGVAGRFEIVPGLADATLGRELARLGYFQSGFHASLICKPYAPSIEIPGVAIKKVDDSADLDVFLEAHAAGWNIPDTKGFKANVRGWLDEPRWSLYLARIDAKAAATGILYTRDRVGYCADAATHPKFRGRGLQLALLRHRIADASAAGVDFVCSGAAYLSTSHRNMERVGMRLQFLRALWTSEGKI